MKAQPKRFADRVFESVSSNSFDFYKITSPLVKIIEDLEKSSGRFVGGVVVNDTIGDTINSLLDNERTVFEQMRMRPEITANVLSEILIINLRITKNIIDMIKKKGLVERIGSRKTGDWEAVRV